MIKTQKGFLYKIFASHFSARVRKGCVGFYCERELEIEHNCNILTPKLMAVNGVSSRSSDAQPEPWGPLCWVLAFFTASYQHLLWTPDSIGVSEDPFGRVWLSLPHLVSNSVRYSTKLPLACRTQLSYIIVRRPLDLWNRMFNRHQAEITVRQFRGHSLPVHYSVVAQWDFHLVPYYQP